MSRSFLLVLLFLLLAGCSRGPDEIPLLEFPTPTPEVDPEVAREYSVLLANQSRELRRVRDEHSSLIASIPPTAGPEPTLTVSQEQLIVAEETYRFPDGIPVSLPEDENWFNPDLGLTFFRDSQGDWSERELRKSNPYAPLFYEESYPEDVLNFADDSILPAIAREMAFEASNVLPILGEPNPSMVEAFADKMGWELRNADAPAINVWTTFTVRERRESFEYVVGGVMMLGVRTLGDGPDGMQYLEPGAWLGPVVVERLR